jgi:F-type H+-transporting ATPase subunit delta
MAENAAIARPYAQAAFELANESGQLAEWSDVLHAAGAVVSDERVAGLIGAPQTDSDQLIELIADIAGKAADSADRGRLINLLKLLTENGRLHALPDIASGYDSLKAEVENRVDVTLTAASPVDAAQQAKIIAALKQRFGRDISLKFELDESLIGGARLQADDLVIDGSVSAGLEKLATQLAT